MREHLAAERLGQKINRGIDHAVVKYEVKNQVPTSDFRLFYDTADGGLGASVISYKPDDSDEGYFLLLASPEIKAKNNDRPAKTAVFVLDRSGSMSGKKMDQAKDALKFVNSIKDILHVPGVHVIVSVSEDALLRGCASSRRLFFSLLFMRISVILISGLLILATSLLFLLIALSSAACSSPSSPA